MIAESDIAAAAAYINRVIGLPWIKGAQGPDAFDCGGLARDCEMALFGRTMPIVNIDANNPLAIARTIKAHPLYAGWVTAPTPRHGDVVTLYRAVTPAHVGVYLAVDRGGLLHATEECGVRFDPLHVLPALGWGNIRFHRPAEAAA